MAEHDRIVLSLTGEALHGSTGPLLRLTKALWCNYIVPCVPHVTSFVTAAEKEPLEQSPWKVDYLRPEWSCVTSAHMSLISTSDIGLLN